MKVLWLLTKRAVREAVRTPEATVPLLFIPVFFLLINLGQLGKQFDPDTTPFLHGQNYAAFQLPVSLIFAVIGIGSGLALVTEIENGYFDKFLVAPIPRVTILLGRLGADFIRNLLTATVVLAIGLAVGVRIEAGVLGAVVLVLLCAFFGMAYGGSAILIALKTGNTQAVNLASLVFFPLLFLSPNVVPRSFMQGWLQALARFNPVTYVLEGTRSLVLDGWVWERLAACLLVTFATAVVLLGLSVRAMRSYGS
ncbi:MAG TPA: ABC transporter permease [Mycobacteriales bacterium]|jgi:ABC-2 type transport system permease protein|nr:ABC transporter permease [Mycobacteriales bacterium]